MSQDMARSKSDTVAPSDILFPLKAFGFPTPELPKLPKAFAGLAKLEVPAPLKDAAEKAAAQIKENYAQLATAGAQSSDLIRETYEQTADQVRVANVKAFDMTRANIAAYFDHVRSLTEARSLAEIISLQSTFMREAVERLQAQATELQAVAQEMTAKAIAPAKAKVEQAAKAFTN